MSKKTKKKKKQTTRKLGFFKKNDLINTPPSLYKVLNDRYKFDFDPCPVNPKFDGLTVEWGNSNFVNPPYSNISKWVHKAVVELEKGKNSVFLITFRSNSKYWFKTILPNASRFVLIAQKIVFPGYQKPFPIPLALVFFEHENRGNLQKNFIKINEEENLDGFEIK